MKKNQKWQFAKTVSITEYILLFVIMCSITLFTSCDNENFFTENEDVERKNNRLDEQSAMQRFAEILSIATYKRTDVREFLKREAIKQFDKNYDVLYIKVKDLRIGNETFEEILSQYTEEGELEQIILSVPTINVFIPQIAACNIYPDNLDCSDYETPVALPEKSTNKLYLNGSVVDSISKGEIPGFHLFVVNKNLRVTVTPETRSSKMTYSFIAPEYDNTKPYDMTRSYLVDGSVVGEKAIKAYSYFNKDDGSNQSKALQRDYIYYGMTPSSAKGNLNQSVTEYLSFIEIDPKAYFNITDTKENNPETDDPEIKKTTASRKKRDFTTEELINEFWTEGNYRLKIEITTSSSNQPLVKRLSVSPDDLWNFNLDRSYRHSTLFRHSKYTYKIDPDKFTAKCYYLTDRSISFGKWDLSNESLCREITFIEEDPGETYTRKYSFETTKANNSKVNGNVKIGLGLGDGNSINTDLGGEINSSTTTKETIEISVTRTNKDDDLGTDRIYFYDPIIEGISDGQYNIKVYNTGIVSFGMTAI